MFPGKKSIRYYVGRAIKANFDDDEVETSFMQSLGRDRQEMDDPVAVLTDITKAYPRVNRIMLWHMLDMWGMKEKIKRVLRGIHEGIEYRVRGREGNSSEWIPRRGLREGCATSPVLFNIYHSNVIRIAREERGKGWNQTVEYHGIGYLEIRYHQGTGGEQVEDRLAKQLP